MLRKSEGCERFSWVQGMERHLVQTEGSLPTLRGPDAGKGKVRGS